MYLRMYTYTYVYVYTWNFMFEQPYQSSNSLVDRAQFYHYVIIALASIWPYQTHIYYMLIFQLTLVLSYKWFYFYLASSHWTPTHSSRHATGPTVSGAQFTAQTPTIIVPHSIPPSSFPMPMPSRPSSKTAIAWGTS